MLNNPSRVFSPPGRDGRDGREGPQGPRGRVGPKGMIRCCTELVGNLSKGLFEPPTFTGSAHFIFLSSGFVQIFQLNCLYKYKETSKQYTFYSVKAYYKGNVLTSSWRGRSCDRLPQKIFRNSNENHILNTLHKVYFWKEKPIYFNYELFSQLILS